ncbi:uncharacterized protein LOC142659928 isoform X1 [Rhinoderma darwinii]|uniref:uncharacterized protein LOC142659928 isoform X1 n=1 Tax=Rhinoderma darwinii TaxID=43563 RepID=UPI003F66AFC9
MSARRSDTSSKRKRTTPQKLKNRKLFAVSENDLIESPHFSKARDGENQDSQLCLSQFPETLHNRENVPKSLHQTPSKKESLTEKPQNKENMPGKYSSVSATAHRGRGRPKGSKNKTFPVSATRVYSVREGKSPIYSLKKEGDMKHQDDAETPHRGRGRPKGSTKVRSSGQDIPKRSRGRPKGSKNKKPSKAALLKIIPGPQKVGRGRPRKLPSNEGETPKRGRGRPKGSLNKSTSAKKLTVISGTHEKKKPGRPKKMVLHHTAVSPLTPKRPRGRPKSAGGHVPVPSNLLKRLEYCAQVEGDDEDDDDEEEDDDEDNDSDE